jgi:large subunit ribosomal protein L35
MPKMKTHSGTKKRFRATGTGKLRGRSAFSTHILEKKSAKRKRRLAQPAIISTRDRARVRELLGAKAPREAKRVQPPVDAKEAKR